MNKELLRKVKLGLITLSAFGLLAACGNDTMTEDPAEDPGMEMPGTTDEDPADEGGEEDDSGTGGGAEEETDN